MGMNSTPASNRIHIGFFGKRNAGKSSVVNAVTGQDLAVVSEVRGTTTDPVYKSMELLPMGPVMIIDTPGFDDEGSLGDLRVRKARQVLNKTDVAVLIVDAADGKHPCDEELIGLFTEKEIPYIVAYNKTDLIDESDADSCDEHEIYISALTGDGIHELKEMIARSVEVDEERFRIVADLIEPEDFVVLVVPIDSAAPKGRLILPQQQVIRDVLEADAAALVVKENGLEETLKNAGKKPSLVVTDSQAFEVVARIVPDDIPLTSFSILMARWKGFLDASVEAVCAIDGLRDGDKVLIAEGCTHHRQCDDIGTVKIPRWLKNYTGKDIHFATCSGTEFPEDLSEYKIVIHCGGCMLNEREVRHRMDRSLEQGVPFTNYGVLIAYMNGILKRSLEVFPYLYEKL